MSNTELERTNKRAVLPPIPNNSIAKYQGGNAEQLDKRVERLEIANLQLVDIVFQLKNNLQTVFEESKAARPAATESKFFFSSDNDKETQMRLETSVMKLAEELLQLKNQSSLQAEYVANSTDTIADKARKIQHDCSTNLDILADRVTRIQDDSRQIIDCASTHADFSAGISSAQSEIRQLKAQFNEVIHSQTNSESGLAFRLTEVVQKLQNEVRDRETSIIRLETLLQDTKHMQESTRMVLENQLTGLLSESQAKLMDRETVTRTDLLDKMQQLERMILSEREFRSGREKEMHSLINEARERAITTQNEAVNAMRENVQRSMNKTADGIVQLEDGIRLVEQNTDEKLRKYYQVMAAEIGARKKLQETMRGDVQILEERIRAATAAMQLAVSGLANRIRDQSDLDQLRQDLERRSADSQLYLSRTMADVDSQIQQMGAQISAISVNVESRLAQATTDLASEVRETLSSVMAWQANSTAHLREMQNIRVSIMQELSKMQLTLNHIESEIPAQVTMETDERITAIADIRHQMETLKMAVNTTPPVKEVDIDRIRESIRKLAETLSTMKSSVGMKIQSEQDIRVKQISDLQTEMRYLEEQFMKDKHMDAPVVPVLSLEEFKQSHGIRNFFMKPASDDKMELWLERPVAFEYLNRWSMFSAMRWIKLKTKMDKWRKNSKANSKKNKKRLKKIEDAKKKAK